jgi:hypothetical protein
MSVEAPGNAGGIYYKANLDQVVDRFEKLWARESLDRVLVKVDIQNPPNASVTNAMASVPDREKMLEEWERGFAVNKDIADDNLPVVYGEFGGYLIGGFLGAEVAWGTGGAYPAKLIRDMNRYRDYLHFEESNRYFQMQMDLLRFLSERSRGRFAFTEMICIDGMNFIDCVRGGDAYTDVYDNPKEILEIMDFASDLNVRLVREQRKCIPTYRGGRFNFYQIWTPGETIFISVDAYGQCGAEVFERFGRKYVQRLAEEFGGGWLHVHSDAVRLLPSYVTLEKIVAIGLEDWIKPPRAIDHLDEIRERLGTMPLMLNISRQELEERMANRTLPGNALYWVSGVTDTAEANRIAQSAHQYAARYPRKLF